MTHLSITIKNGKKTGKILVVVAAKEKKHLFRKDNKMNPKYELLWSKCEFFYNGIFKTVHDYT